MNAAPERAPLQFRTAEEKDAPIVAELVNSAYRGDSSRLGWTTEADLLDGQRTDAADVLRLLQAAGSSVLLAQCCGELWGVVHLERDGDNAHFGMFAVRPSRQRAGVGKRFMAFAEGFVQEQWGAQRMVMSVISCRSELIAFYERRGYRRTGTIRPFPSSRSFGIPRVGGLVLEALEKELLSPIRAQPEQGSRASGSIPSLPS